MCESDCSGSQNAVALCGRGSHRCEGPQQARVSVCMCVYLAALTAKVQWLRAGEVAVAVWALSKLR